MAKTAAEKRVEELANLKEVIKTSEIEDDKAVLESKIAELEKKIKEDKEKAKKPKVVNLDKEFKKAHKTFATGAQEMVRRVIRNR